MAEPIPTRGLHWGPRVLLVLGAIGSAVGVFADLFGVGYRGEPALAILSFGVACAFALGLLGLRSFAGAIAFVLLAVRAAIELAGGFGETESFAADAGNAAIGLSGWALAIAALHRRRAGRERITWVATGLLAIAVIGWAVEVACALLDVDRGSRIFLDASTLGFVASLPLVGAIFTASAHAPPEATAKAGRRLLLLGGIGALFMVAAIFQATGRDRSEEAFVLSLAIAGLAGIALGHLGQSRKRWRWSGRIAAALWLLQPALLPFVDDDLKVVSLVIAAVGSAQALVFGARDGARWAAFLSVLFIAVGLTAPLFSLADELVLAAFFGAAALASIHFLAAADRSVRST